MYTSPLSGDSEVWGDASSDGLGLMLGLGLGLGGCSGIGEDAKGAIIGAGEGACDRDIVTRAREMVSTSVARVSAIVSEQSNEDFVL